MAKQKFNNLPKELTDKPRWISVNENKIPITEKWQHPENQKYVSDIQAPLKGFDISGHGVDDDYLVLDFDHVFTDNGEWVNAEAERVYTWITSSAPTYIERSISKTGFHMLYKPTKGTFETINSNKDNNIYFIEGNKDSKIEFFYKTAGRQFVLTGDCEGLCKEQTEIASGEKVDSFLKELVAYSHSLKNKVTNKEFTAPSNSAQSNSFELNAQNANLWVEDVLNLIDVEQLNRPEWVNTGTSLKQLGISFDVFNRWSSQDTGLTSDGKKNRYDESDCWYQWNSFKDTGDTNAAVGQLINLAREYDPDGFKNVWHELQDLDLKRKADKTAELLRKSKEKPAQGEEESSPRITQIGDFFNNHFDSEVEEYKKYAYRKTGFTELDEKQIFAPGLYVIGGLSALGKTTLLWQLAEQLADRGEYVIYVSYEMSALDMFSKTLARRVKIADPSSKLSAADIRRGSWNATVSKVKAELKQLTTNLNVYEAEEDNVDTLISVVSKISVQSDKSPVVFIDYLQIMPHNQRDPKQGIDEIVRKLKAHQRKTNATFIVISSFNRQNYRSNVTFESFKESGGIEYSADVVWGLQLGILNDKEEANKQDVEKALRKIPRHITLKCLKNRTGSLYNVDFHYNPRFDLIKEYIEDWDKEVDEDTVRSKALKEAIKQNKKVK